MKATSSPAMSRLPMVPSQAVSTVPTLPSPKSVNGGTIDALPGAVPSNAVPSKKPSERIAQELKGHWKVFSEEEIASEFHRMPWAEITLEATLDEVIKALMTPEFWNDSDERDNSTRVSMIDRHRDGKVSYLRNVKTTFGPAKLRFRLWTTSWVEKQGAEGDSAIVHMHAYDDGTQSIHVVSRFVLSQVSAGILVRYEEKSRNTKTSINLATSKIKKTHRRVLQLIAAQVVKVKMSKEGGGEAEEVGSALLGPIQEEEGQDEESGEEEVHWQDLPLDKIRQELMHGTTGVKVSDRQRGMKTYHNVWVANEAVDWLVENYPLTRDSAVELMRALQKRGFVVSRKAKRVVEFADEHLLFRWADPTVVPVRVLDRKAPKPERPLSPSMESGEKQPTKFKARLRRQSQGAGSAQAGAAAVVTSAGFMEEPVMASPPHGGSPTRIDEPASLTSSLLSIPMPAAPLETSSSVEHQRVVPSAPVQAPVLQPSTVPEEEKPFLTSKRMAAVAAAAGIALAYVGGFPTVPFVIWMVTVALVWKLQGEVKKVREQLQLVQHALDGVRLEQQTFASRALAASTSEAAASVVADDSPLRAAVPMVSAPAILAPHTTNSVLLINGQRPNGEPQTFETEYAHGSILFKSRTNPMDPGVAPYFQGRNRMFELQCCFKLKQPIPEDHVVWVGAEIDGRLYMSTMIKFFVSTMLSLLRMFNTSLHHSFGGENERSHLMFPFHVFPDTIIIVPDGSPVPPLTLSNLPSVPKPEKVDIIPGRSFVMSFYSQYVDFENWTIQKLPGMNGVSLEKFWGKHPIHIVAYSIPKSSVIHDTNARRLMMDIEIFNPIKTSKEAK